MPTVSETTVGDLCARHIGAVLTVPVVTSTERVVQVIGDDGALTTRVAVEADASDVTGALRRVQHDTRDGTLVSLDSWAGPLPAHTPVQIGEANG